MAFFIIGLGLVALGLVGLAVVESREVARPCWLVVAVGAAIATVDAVLGPQGLAGALGFT